MFRFSAFLVCLFTLLATISGSLQRLLPTKIQFCTEYSSCYEQLGQIIGQTHKKYLGYDEGCDLIMFLIKNPIPEVPH